MSVLSIIIPAHNEMSVIRRCLIAILKDAEENEFDIFVVCNGCDDDTANIARSFGSAVKVLETDTASKIHALNLGDKHAQSFPRIYVDADIVIDASAVRGLAAALKMNDCLVASPQMKVDLSQSSYLVCSFYHIWMKLPYFKQQMIGCGVYALSSTGRSRFGEFPNVIADDCYIRLMFNSEEKASLKDEYFVMFPPKSISDLIKINARRQSGHEQMRCMYNQTLELERSNQRQVLVSLIFRPRLWPALTIYVLVKFLTIVKYRTMKKKGRHKTWLKDHSSR